MDLSEKYGVPKEAISKMIKDGVISCSWRRYEEVYYIYKKNKVVDKISAARKTCDETGLSSSTVYEIIHRFE